MEKLDMFGFMIWYLDDGSYGSSKANPRSKPTIGAKGWDTEQLVELSDILNRKFSLSTYVYTCRHYEGMNKVVKVPAKNRWLIEEWKKIAKDTNVPQCMYYKLGLIQ